MKSYKAEKSAAGMRLDVWLDGLIEDLSRSRIQSLIRSGDIRLDGKIMRCHARIAPGMYATVVIPPPSSSKLDPQPIPLDIIWEDEALIVLNKQAGLVVHPAAGHASGTLVNALLNHDSELLNVGGEQRPGIVHRLDKDTSGVMVVARTDASMRDLAAQFKSRAVKKEYKAIVLGCPRSASGTIETDIGRNPRNRKTMSTRPGSGARKAVTHYSVEKKLKGASLIGVRIETGRTHQIRVHMAHMGHPVLGDRQYGRARHPDVRPERQMLHAAKLAFKHPRTGEPLSFKAPLPQDMVEVIKVLGA